MNSVTEEGKEGAGEGERSGGGREGGGNRGRGEGERGGGGRGEIKMGKKGWVGVWGGNGRSGKEKEGGEERWEG